MKVRNIYLGFFSCLLLLVGCKDHSISDNHKLILDPALLALNRSIESNSKNDSLYYYRANYFYKLDSLAAAISDLKKALSIDSTQKPDYYLLLADVYLANAESKNALDIVDLGLTFFPNDISTILKSAQLKLILKQHMAALTTLDKIFVRDPQNAEAYYLAGHIFYEMGDTGRAVNSYQKAVDFNPEMRAAWIQLGDVLTDLKNPKALSYYQNAIHLDSLEPEIFHKKAFALNYFGNTTEAIELYKKICVQFPNYELSYYNLGFLFMELDSLDRAIEHFSIAIKINPAEASSYYQRGIVFQKLKKQKEAKSDFQNALQLDSTLLPAQEALELLK